jgi:hypothetical protein
MGLMPLFGGSMSFSVNTPVSDGVETQFPITFSNGIFSRASVFVYVEDDVDGGGNQLERAYTWINDGLIELDVVAPAGKVVTIRRIMQKDVPAVDFVDGAILDEQNLDEQANHLLNTMHEVLDGYGAESIHTDVNMNGNKITNVFTDPNDPNSLATVGYIGDNADRAEAAQAAAEAAEAGAQASAVSASNSAVSASSDAGEATASLYEFKGKWYGSYASDPVLDPNGDARTEGDTYWNSTDNELKVFNGTAWESTVSAISTIKNEVSVTNVQGQTVFSVTYDVGYLEVYYNGVRLLPGTDFIASDGVTYTLTTPVADNADYLTAVAFGSFDVANPEETRTALDVYSKAEVDNGRRNYLINANLNTTIVNQRGFAGGQPAAGDYGYDRWKGDALGTRIEQVVENTEVINREFTLSWVGGTGTADVDGVTGLNSGDTFTINTSANFSVIVPTDATYVQLESGSVATPFEYVDPATQLARCQRYYEKSYMLGRTIGSTGREGSLRYCAANAVDSTQYSVNMLVRKRANPAVTLYAPDSGNVGKIRDMTIGADNAAVADAIGETAFYVNNGSGHADGRVYGLHFTADAEL